MYPSVANRCVRARHVLAHAEDGMAKDHHAGSAGAGGETSSGHPTTSGLQPVLAASTPTARRRSAQW